MGAKTPKRAATKPSPQDKNKPTSSPSLNKTAAMPKSAKGKEVDLFSFARLSSRSSRAFIPVPPPVDQTNMGQPRDCRILQMLPSDVILDILDLVDPASIATFALAGKATFNLVDHCRNRQRITGERIRIVPALEKCNIEEVNFLDLYARDKPETWPCAEHGKLHKVDLSTTEAQSPGCDRFHDVPGRMIILHPMNSSPDKAHSYHQHLECDNKRFAHIYDARCGMLRHRHVYLALKYARLDHSLGGQLKGTYKRYMEALLATRLRKDNGFKISHREDNQLRLQYKTSPRIVVGPRLVDEECVMGLETENPDKSDRLRSKQVLRYVQKSEWQYQRGEQGISFATLGVVRACPHLAHRPQDVGAAPALPGNQSDDRLTRAIVSVMLPGRPHPQVDAVGMNGTGSPSSGDFYGKNNTIPSGTTIETTIGCRWCRTEVTVQAVFNTHDSVDLEGMAKEPSDGVHSDDMSAYDQFVLLATRGNPWGNPFAAPRSLSEFKITTWQDLGPEMPEGSMTWLDSVAHSRVFNANGASPQPTKHSQAKLYKKVPSLKKADVASDGFFRDGTKVGSVKDMYEQSTLHVHAAEGNEPLENGENVKELHVEPKFRLQPPKRVLGPAGKIKFAPSKPVESASHKKSKSKKARKVTYRYDDRETDDMHSSFLDEMYSDYLDEMGAGHHDQRW